MQDTFCPSVSPKFSFGAAGKERGLHFLTSLAADMKSAEEDAYSYTPNVSLSLPLGMGNPCLATQYHTLQTSPVISVSSCHQTGYSLQNDNHAASGYYLPHGLRPNGAPALESPRIEITAYSQYPEDEVEESNSEDHIIKRGVNSIVTLTLPNADGYRDPSCLSPASSVSSRSCNSDASSYESGFYNYDNSPQNSPWQSPCVSPKGTPTLMSCPHANGPVASPHHSPSNSPQIGAVAEEGWPAQPRGSRPNSPSCSGGNGVNGGGMGKRKYSFNGTTYRQTSCSPIQSPIPSPHISPRVSVTDENWLANTNQYTNSAIVAAINALTTDGVVDLGEGIPIKTRKTMLDHSMGLKLEPGDLLSLDRELCHEDYPSRMALKKENYGGGFLDVPQHPYSWSKPKPYLSPSLPSLDWQLPSCSGPYNLQIEVQPKSHHRAHYETEGSRGAVKALCGSHPVVQLYGYMESEPLTLQLFIGTADDRLLRPHAFYQVHRITGKTVSTASHEVMQSNTKVLEIPLLPENNMRAIIDCAGILKLRNSDIELRKGETDIGRKNTRVKLVFRVHINQPNGRTLSLQASSNAIECSQRSAQELPLVEKQSVESYPATGGKMMLLSGLNFLPDSKVVFVEKAQDGHHLWETEAKVDKDSVKNNSLVVEIPPYRNQRISSPVQVDFYVCNGKRKRSQCQTFTFLPPNVPIIKTEPNDEYDSLGTARLPMHSKPFYSRPRPTPIMTLTNPDDCLVGGYTPCPPRHTAMPSSSPSSSPTLHDLSPVAYSKCFPNSPDHVAPPGPVVTPIQETSGRPNLVHPASPDHNSSLGMLHSQGSPNHLNSPGPHGYHTIYDSSSPSSSPVSQPSTPGGTEDSPFVQAYSPGPGQTHTGESSPSLLTDDDDASPPSMAITVKQEPQELDQMYLDDVNEIIRNDLSSISVHTHA
ncbi:nuclear factor of activated T-cells, cytoplasmic 1-like isoform X1 [Notothenia coriiceps]|uniref:Nuclear factor of activated T-cells, cytoplasmic 1-like isoform X1 n=1 Tax=Notothenia coriiceps TaxID=8208 RepID=A0A6I9ML16_9TELE|nr:PREDICTED: nuclear factor of activated T-cells, cytoplasmic 1-like isoform X1 [Notothenia coriiceps]